MEESITASKKQVMEEQDPSSVTDMKKFMKRAKLPYHPYNPISYTRSIPSGSFVVFVQCKEDDHGTHTIPYGCHQIDGDTLGYIVNDYKDVCNDVTIGVTVPSLGMVYVPSRNIRILKPEFILKFRSKQIEEAKKVLKQNKHQKIGHELAESLEAIFPQNWDLRLVPLFGSKFQEYHYEITIRFPEFVIENGNGLSHTIKDLYVFFKLQPKGRMVGKLEGKRGTLSYVEAACGYRHSHLPTAQAGLTGRRNVKGGRPRNISGESFQAFCLGSTDISELVSLWNSRRMKFSQEEFELLLYQIDAYVRWESLQGGPYFRLSNLAADDSRGLYLSHSVKEACYQAFLKQSKDFECKFNKESGLFELEEERIEKRLRMKECPKVRRTPDGTYIMGNQTPHTIKGWIEYWNSNLDMDSKSLPAIETFQGKSIDLKVDAFIEKDKESAIKQVPHPDVTKHVTTKLRVAMNHYFTTNYGK